MPKELFVNDSQPDEGLDWLLDVRWGRNTYVQMATYKSAPLDVLGGANQVWIDFNRADLNRLIRILRKARDQAYGSDA